MPSSSDTLDFSSMRPAAPAPSTVIMPDAAVTVPPAAPARADEAAAAAARARIQALANEADTFRPAGMATPAHLETSKAELARDVAAVEAASATAPVTASPGPARGRFGLPPVPAKLKPVVSAAIVFVLLLALLKSPIIVGQLNYTFNKPDTTATQTATTGAAAVAPASTDTTLSIPKIGVTAPIVYEPSVEEASVQKALESGIVHYGNTPKPGAGGNAVLFGHSSNDWWEPGNYKFIFGLLEKVTTGDRFTVNYDGVRYEYEVTGTKTVAPTDVSVLNATSEPTMTLITCTPVGTSLNRFVVTAKQISPAPTAQASSQAQTGTSATGTLPGEGSTTTQGGFFDAVLSWFGL